MSSNGAILTDEPRGATGKSGNLSEARAGGNGGRGIRQRRRRDPGDVVQPQIHSDVRASVILRIARPQQLALAEQVLVELPAVLELNLIGDRVPFGGLAVARDFSINVGLEEPLEIHVGNRDVSNSLLLEPGDRTD